MFGLVEMVWSEMWTCCYVLVRMMQTRCLYSSENESFVLHNIFALLLVARCLSAHACMRVLSIDQKHSSSCNHTSLELYNYGFCIHCILKLLSNGQGYMPLLFASPPSPSLQITIFPSRSFSPWPLSPIPARSMPLIFHQSKMA